MTRSRVEIDPPIRRLVKALNSFAGVHTLGSCGGHPAPLKGGQWPEGTWYVTFVVDHTLDGWFGLEFLSWALNNDYDRAGHHVTLYPTAPPPYLNGPGTVLRFAVEGYEAENADVLANHLLDLKNALYVPPRRAGRRHSPTARHSEDSTGALAERPSGGSAPQP